MRYYSLNQYLQNTFGCKVYKLSLSSGLSCPNRDGTLSYKGCIFCNGSGDFSIPLYDSEGIDYAKSLVQNKCKTNCYIAYFQDHTNTYCDIQYLRKMISSVINRDDICAISLATRPDCITPEILELLKVYNQIKPVWIELGLQSIHQSTAEYINRQYDLVVYDKTVMELKKIGVHIVTHLIIGLPNETPNMIYDSVKYVAKAGTDGVKFHMLYIDRESRLFNEYKNGIISVMSLPEYAEVLSNCIRFLPKNIVVHRITGDGSKLNLIAPLWSSDKKHVLNYLQNYFDENDVIQGDFA